MGDKQRGPEEEPEEGPDVCLGGLISGWPHNGDNRKKGDKLKWIWDLDPRTAGVPHEGRQEPTMPSPSARLTTERRNYGLEIKSLTLSKFNLRCL